jgi:hypothetical protein
MSFDINYIMNGTSKVSKQKPKKAQPFTFKLLGKPLGILGDRVTKPQRKVLKSKNINTMFGDWDKDGVINGLDCQPRNKRRHGFVSKFKNWTQGRGYQEPTVRTPQPYLDHSQLREASRQLDEINKNTTSGPYTLIEDEDYPIKKASPESIRQKEKEFSDEINRRIGTHDTYVKPQQYSNQPPIKISNLKEFRDSGKEFISYDSKGQPMEFKDSGKEFISYDSKGQPREFKDSGKEFISYDSKGQPREFKDSGREFISYDSKGQPREFKDSGRELSEYNRELEKLKRTIPEQSSPSHKLNIKTQSGSSLKQVVDSGLFYDEQIKELKEKQRLHQMMMDRETNKLNRFRGA